jgi:hypothetical protein
MGILMPQGLTLYFIIALVFVFITVTVYALIKNFKKQSMEILFKKPFYKDKPEDIKNKILNEM